MSNIVTINDTELQVIEYQGQRVATLAQIDDVHKRPDGTARRTFNDHKHRLIEGQDYFVRDAYEAREMGFTAPNGLILMTEQGYTMLVKPFGDDLAWQVQRNVVNGYFRAKEAAALPPPAGTKPARVRSTPTSDRVKALAFVTREIARVPGVRPEAAASAFLAIVERDTGLPVSELRSALPATPPEVAFQLNPTFLAKRLEIEGLKASHINLALIALGFQEEGERDYVVTAKGAEYGEMRSYTNQHNGHQGYQSVWSAAVVPLLAAYFAEHPDAAKPLPKAPRKHTKKAAAPEPQGALL